MAALEYFAIRVARLLDEPEHGIASLPEVFKVLRDPAVREAVLDVAIGASIDRAQREQRMDSAVQCWRRVRKDARFKRLRRLRDHTLAHNLIYKTMHDGLEAPLWTVDLIAYGDDVFRVVSALSVCHAIAIGAKHLSIDDPKLDKSARLSVEPFSQTFGPLSFEASVAEVTASTDGHDAFKLADECVKEWDDFLKGSQLL